MKKLLLIGAIALVSLTTSAQTFTQGEVDNIKVESCEHVINVDGSDTTHNHYVFVVHDTVNDWKYTFTDTTLADPIPSGGLKAYLNDTLLNVVKIVPATPYKSAIAEPSVVGTKIEDL